MDSGPGSHTLSPSGRRRRTTGKHQTIGQLVLAASLKSRCALLLVEDLWEVGAGCPTTSEIPFERGRDEGFWRKWHPSNKKSRFLVWGKMPESSSVYSMPGKRRQWETQGGCLQCQNSWFKKKEFLIVSLKASPSLGELGTRCHNSESWYLRKYHKVLKALALREGMSWRFCLSQGFGRMGVFHPGCSVKPRLFLPVEVQTSGKVLCWNWGLFLMQTYFWCKPISLFVN